MPHEEKNLMMFVGQQRGQLHVDYLSHYEDSTAMFHCSCSCGNKVLLTAKNLNFTKLKSCGCLNKKKVHILTDFESIWLSNQSVRLTKYDKSGNMVSKAFNIQELGIVQAFALAIRTRDAIKVGKVVGTEKYSKNIHWVNQQGFRLFCVVNYRAEDDFKKRIGFSVEKYGLIPAYAKAVRFLRGWNK